MNEAKNTIKHEPEIFTSMPLKRFPECMNPGSTDKVYFPKIEQEIAVDPDNDDCLHAFWMAGFLHHEKEENENLASKDLSLFLRLPGSTVLPMAAAAVRKKEFNQGHRMLHTGNNGMKEYSMVNDIKSQMTQEEQLHLDMTLNRTKKKKMHDLAHNNSPYHSINSKLRKVLRRKQPLPIRNVMKSKLLEAHFEINRSEKEAAIVIQCILRRCKAFKVVKNIKLQQLCATIIQASVRGIHARRWVSVWKLKRSLFTVKCQAHLRRRIDTRKWKRRKKREFISTTIIQSTIRFYLERCKLELFRKNQAGTLIQAQYRGSKGRTRSLRIKKRIYVVVIQSLARSFLSRIYYTRLIIEKNTAAIGIGRCWRGYTSRKIRNELLYEREISRCRNYIHTLLVTHQQTRPSEDRIQHDTIRQSLHHHRLHLQSLEEKLDGHETNIIELKRSASYMSPRSVQKGWLDQTNINIHSERDTITKTKLDIVFKARPNLRKATTQLLEYGKSIDESTCQRKRERQWIDEMTSGIWHCQRERHQQRRELKTRQAIADEKRRWAINDKRIKKSTGKIRTKPHLPINGRSPQFYTNMSTTENDKLQSSKIHQQCQKHIDNISLGNYNCQLQQCKAMLGPFENIMESKIEKVVKSAKDKREAHQASNHSVHTFQDNDSTHMTKSSYPKTNLPISNSFEDAKTNQRITKYTPKVRSNNLSTKLPWRLLGEIKIEKQKMIQGTNRRSIANDILEAEGRRLYPLHP